MNIVTKLLAVIALPFVLGSGAAALQVDQSMSSAQFQIHYHSPVAQSFHVAVDQLGSISVLAVDMNAFGDFLLDRNITLTLREGSGLAGVEVARSTVDAASMLGGAGIAWVTFNLGGVSVVPAAPYTFQLEVATPRFGVAAQQDDVYGGGRAYFTDGNSGQSFGAEYDLTFRVAAVDEPPATLLLLGGLAAGCLRRKSSRHVLSHYQWAIQAFGNPRRRSADTLSPGNNAAS